MSGFAYLDKYGILHVAGSKETAEKYAVKSGVVATDLSHESGYIDENGMNVYVEVGTSGTEFWHGKNKNKEHQLTEADFAKKYPGTYALYKKLI